MQPAAESEEPRSSSGRPSSSPPPPLALSAAGPAALTAHQALMLSAALGGAVEASGGKLLGPNAMRVLARFAAPGVDAAQLVPTVDALEALVRAGHLPGFTYAFNILRRDGAPLPAAALRPAAAAASAPAPAASKAAPADEMPSSAVFVKNLAVNSFLLPFPHHPSLLGCIYSQVHRVCGRV